MNKPIPPQSYQAQTVQTPDGSLEHPRRPDGTSKPATETNAGDAAPVKPVLTPVDLSLIRRALLTGDKQVALRSDLVELHGRMVKLFTTLNEGLSDAMGKKAAADRAQLSSRIDELEAAVNRMEGALRIELEPVLRSVVADAVAERTPVRAKPIRSFVLGLALVLAGLGAGAVYSSEINVFYDDIVKPLFSNFGGN